ncbi:MAG TPA: hypothetical protein VM344_09410 [Vitreimonas sp.]|nr:hypothetical protein [Vitreimonas sp.]
MQDDTLRAQEPGRDREAEEALDRSRAPVDQTEAGYTDGGELSPDRDEAIMNPVANEGTDANVDRR